MGMFREGGPRSASIDEAQREFAAGEWEEMVHRSAVRQNLKRPAGRTSL